VGHDELHLHDLRHAAGTLAAWTGATERELMARLGHANPAASRRYQHAARDRDRAIAAGLDVILQGLQKSDAR
jgi:integrase